MSELTCVPVATGVAYLPGGGVSVYAEAEREPDRSMKRSEPLLKQNDALDALRESLVLVPHCGVV